MIRTRLRQWWKPAGLVFFALTFLLVTCQPTVPGLSKTQPRPGGSNELIISSFGGAWGQAIQVGLIDGFERESGVKVTLRPTQDWQASASAVRSDRLPPEDLIDTNLATAVALSRDRLITPIDYGRFDPAVLEKLPTYARLPEMLGWGQFGIGLCYDREVFRDPANVPRSWVDFWNVTKFPGMRGMLVWPEEPQPEFGLLADGVRVSDLYPIDLDRAYRKLSELRPYLPRFPVNPGELGDLLVNREVAMAACFTHRAQRLIDEGQTRIAISFDQARLQTEYAVVWRNAPNRENAMKFLAYIVRAEPQAAWARAGNTGPINPDAFKTIPADLASRLPTSPSYPGSWPKNDEWYAAISPSGRTNRELISERWSSWLAECGAGGDRDLPGFRGPLIGSRGCR